MLLRMLRRSREGQPSLLARVVAALVLLGLLALTAPGLSAPTVAAVRWLVGLL